MIKKNQLFIHAFLFYIDENLFFYEKKLFLLKKVSIKIKNHELIIFMHMYEKNVKNQ